MFYLLLFIAGLFGGFVGGLIGIGGGIIFILILPAALAQIGVPAEELTQYQVANSLFAMVFSSLAANYSQIKAKNFFPKEVAIIGASAVVSSLILQYTVVNTPLYDKHSFNIVVLVLLSYMLLRTLIFARREGTVTPALLPRKKLVWVGLVSGSVTSLSGLGGGIVIIPLLNTLLKLPVKAANSISMGVIGISALVVTVSNLYAVPRLPFHHYNVGYIIFPVALALSAGVISTGSLGVRVSKKLPAYAISYIFSGFIGITILKTLWELGAFKAFNRLFSVLFCI